MFSSLNNTDKSTKICASFQFYLYISYKTIIFKYNPSQFVTDFDTEILSTNADLSSFSQKLQYTFIN